MDYYKKMTDKYRATFGDDFEPKQFKHKNAEYWQYVKDLYFGWYGAYEIYRKLPKQPHGIHISVVRDSLKFT